MGTSPALVIAQADDPRLKIRRSPVTGLASFVTAADGGAIPLDGVAANAVAQPTDFLRVHGKLFGVEDVAAQLVATKTEVDSYSFTHSSFSQVHKGLPVFGGVLRTHQDRLGAFKSANGDFFPIPNNLNTIPSLTAEQAQLRAKLLIDRGAPTVTHSELLIVDPGWYGDPPAGAHLAYHIILEDLAAGVREAFFIDAHTGKSLDQWDLSHNARDRFVVDDTSIEVRSEGDDPTGDPDLDAAYDYSGDYYDYLFRAFSRDSIDGAGTMLFSTVHLVSGSCPNAFGGTGGTFYCDGVATDDIVAHEFTHGLTGFTANLIYQNQSGQLNESFSDVLGEIIDLLNGNASSAGTPGGTLWPPHGSGSGTDTPNSLRTGCVSSAQMVVNAPGNIAGTYVAQPASFGPPLTPTGITEDVVVANPVRGCDIDLPFTNAAAMPGKIVLIDRGDCTFTEKVRNAQDEGAIGVLIVNNLPLGLPPMGGSDPTITIPSLGISQADGQAIKDAVPGSVNVTMKDAGTIDVRWLVGEDSSGFGGHIRDMWMPSCEGDPDTANHPFQTCSAADNGGVHSGSGVPNHAFAIATDGKTFNGHTVTGIGLFKAGAVWYRALTLYLTPTSDFEDAYAAFNQAAADLVGQIVKDPRDGSDFGTFTSADAVEIDEALLAVEMDTRGLCGSNEVLDANPPTLCEGRTTIYSDDFESGVNGWTVSVSGPLGPPTPYNWVQTGGLPVGEPGVAWFADDPDIGDCGANDESAMHSLFSPTIILPGSLNDPTLAFRHFVATESGYDGGNVKISVNAGAWQVVPSSAFTYNAYNQTLVSAGDGSSNPMESQPAWTGGVPGAGLGGGGNAWGTSLVDLSGLALPGNSVRFRFDFGKDGCAGVQGWYVDDFEVFTCPGGTQQSPPTEGDDTCQTSSTPGSGTPCSSNADCTIAGEVCGLKSRYISITPSNAVVAGGNTSIQVEIASMKECAGGVNVGRGCEQNSQCPGSTCVNSPNIGDIWWAGPEVAVSNLPQAALRGALLECTLTPNAQAWTNGVLHLYGPPIVPLATYNVRMCDAAGSNCSDPLLVATGEWGDAVRPYGGPAQPAFIDINAVVFKFRNLGISEPMPRVDLVGLGNPGEPNSPNQAANFTDISACVDGFREIGFAYTVPACP